MLDWTTCPHCHEPLEIIRILHYEGAAYIRVATDDGQLVAAIVGETSFDEIDDGPPGYICAACAWPLPPEYYDAIASVLD